MNFLNKNHEHKIINVKNVSKKIILGIVFVFATVSFTNAKNYTNNSNSNSSKMDGVERYPMTCMEAAFKYGDEMAGLAGGDAYYWTEVYYSNFCS